jgi:invasion protein IalB
MVPSHSGRRIDYERLDTPRADGVTVYYPFALVELLSFREVDDNEAGEVLLSFMDEDGCQVTVRVRREVLEALKSRLAQPPDSSS